MRSVTTFVTLRLFIHLPVPRCQPIYVAVHLRCVYILDYLPGFTISRSLPTHILTRFHIYRSSVASYRFGRSTGGDCYWNARLRTTRYRCSLIYHVYVRYVRVVHSFVDSVVCIYSGYSHVVPTLFLHARFTFPRTRKFHSLSPIAFFTPLHVLLMPRDFVHTSFLHPTIVTTTITFAHTAHSFTLVYTFAHLRYYATRYPLHLC